MTAAALDKKRLRKILRLLGSDHDGEVLAAARKLKKLCATEGASINDLAISIDDDSEAPEQGYSEAEAVTIFERGREAGRAEAQSKELEFFDSDGSPRRFEITTFNRDNAERIRDRKSRDFAVDVVDRMLRRPPSLKQAVWILQIFVRLGGTISPETKARYF